MTQAIIVHGGAWDIADELVDAHREACLAAVGTGWQALQSGGTALDAVERAIRVMIDHPGLNAGVGSFLNADGVVEMDAGIMDGATLNAGRVAAVQGVRHPITLARKVMEGDHVLLVGPGARRFALAHGLVGDSPLVGCGYYADDRCGGASCTGWGEGIMRVVLAKAAIDRMSDPQSGLDAGAAARWAIRHLEDRLDGLGGIILLDRHGRVGHAHNTPRMAYAYMRQGQERPVFAI